MKNCPNCQAEMPKDHDICWNCNFDLIDKKVIPTEESKKEPKEEKRKSLNCLRCNTKLIFGSRRNFNRGFNMLDQALREPEIIDLYVCPNCKKVEFYLKMD